ncbi:hypothetical protein PO909_019493 [Leuciscus waleckii]
MSGPLSQRLFTSCPPNQRLFTSVLPNLSFTSTLPNPNLLSPNLSLLSVSLSSHPASLSHLPPLNPSSTTACQPLSSSNHLHGGGVAVGLPAYSSSLVGGSLVSTSNLRDQDSASARWSINVLLAPTSLSSTVAYLVTRSARLPRPPGSTLVARQPSLTSGLHSCPALVHPTFCLPFTFIFVFSGFRA